MNVSVDIVIEEDVIPNDFVLKRITETIKEEMSKTNSAAYTRPEIVYCGCGFRLATISFIKRR